MCFYHQILISNTTSTLLTINQPKLKTMRVSIVFLEDKLKVGYEKSKLAIQSVVSITNLTLPHYHHGVAI